LSNVPFNLGTFDVFLCKEITEYDFDLAEKPLAKQHCIHIFDIGFGGMCTERFSIPPQFFQMILV
jgi:hypothetical protein